MVVEVIRGLGLGGAESLLTSRLEHDKRKGYLRTSKVINTHSGSDYFVPRLADTGIDLIDLGTSSRWMSAFRLWRVAASFAPEETVVVHSPWPAAVLKLRRALGLSKHRLVEVTHSTNYAYPMRILGLLLNRYADLCIAVSEDVADGLTTRGFRRVEVVLAGVDRQLMRQWVEDNPTAPEDFRNQLGLNASTRLIVSVGNLRKLKRHAMLIDAIPSLSDDTHVVIVGEGPERNALKEHACKLGVSTRIHLRGQEQDAWRWAAVADVVAHPSEREGLPIALTEARVLEVPIVAFNVGGVGTILKDDLHSTVLSLEDEDSFSEVLASLLREIDDVQSCYSSRGQKQTFWDVERFSADFYAMVRVES